MEFFGATRQEIAAYLSRLGEPEYRAAQITRWLYGTAKSHSGQWRGLGGELTFSAKRSFQDMTDLPVSLRELLSSNCTITRSEIAAKSRSPDGATKFLLRLADGQHIESVLLPSGDRTSVCVSSQVGCSAGCVFCATADLGLIRNLCAGEIVDQVLTIQEDAVLRVSHVVFMGMGEPLANLKNVVKAIRLLQEEVGISMRRITVSTLGITPAIYKLADLRLQLTLAVSLHAPDDELRRELIPAARKFPLAELLRACRQYADHTKRRITFEYMLLADVNDSPAHAARLAQLLKGMLCHVNLIPFNQVEGKPFKRPSRGSIAAFRSILERSGIQVTQRIERGHSIAAACGQLRAAALKQDAISVSHS